MHWCLSSFLVFGLIFCPVISQAGIDFDGTDDIVNCGTGLDTVFNNYGTVSVWIYLKGYSSANLSYAATKYSVTTPWIVIVRNDAGSLNSVQLSVDFSDKTAYWVCKDDTTLNTWCHLLITYDASNVANNPNFYLNGNLLVIDTDDHSAGVVSDFTTEPVSVGGRTTDSTRNYKGIISELAIWDIILSQEEISQLYNSKIRGTPLQIQPNNLKLYLPMDDGCHGEFADGKRVQDLSGNANHGTGDNGAGNTGLTWTGEQVLSSSQQCE